MKYPFNDEPDTMAITCCHILQEKSDILYVSHDEEDGMWQFLCGKLHIISDARIVSMYEMFATDNSVAQIANMPCGYVAERVDKNSDWVIEKNETPA